MTLPFDADRFIFWALTTIVAYVAWELRQTVVGLREVTTFVKAFHEDYVTRVERAADNHTDFVRRRELEDVERRIAAIEARRG